MEVGTLLSILAVATGTAACPQCTDLPITNVCSDPPNMATFWSQGQIVNNLGATFGDLHSISNKYITTQSGATLGSVSFTFGNSSQFIYADLNVYGKCTPTWGYDYDGIQLIVASQQIDVTFDVHIQMFINGTCTAVDGNQDVVFHSADIARFSAVDEYESFVMPFSQAGIDRTRIKSWLITNVSPAGSTLQLGCSSLYTTTSIPSDGSVDNTTATTVSSTSASVSSPMIPVVVTLIVVLLLAFGWCIWWHRRRRMNNPSKYEPSDSSDEMQDSLIERTNMNTRLNIALNGRHPSNYYHNEDGSNDDEHQLGGEADDSYSFDASLQRKQLSSYPSLMRPPSEALPKTPVSQSSQNQSVISAPSIPRPSARLDIPRSGIAADARVDSPKVYQLPEIHIRSGRKGDERAADRTASMTSSIGSSWRGLKDDLMDIFFKYKNQK
ncbi:hypothetical protein HK100_006728 [Physocladia obscura]|uniref:Uncharacterized protein n=1 Tax=Physocladia obscura TaxID=109957 RepID=A0AAD5T5B4_9FUNG|nr:hypothetical protein HK100_006728 [Physocladia obscura]